MSSLPSAMQPFAPHNKRRKPFQSLPMGPIWSEQALWPHLPSRAVKRGRPLGRAFLPGWLIYTAPSGWGGNTTGFSILAADLNGKRQEILIEAVPGVSRIAALADINFTTPQLLQRLQDEARTRGVELLINRVETPEEIVSAIDAAKSSGAAALNVLASAAFYTNRQIIFDRVATLRLPAMYEWPSMAEEGGLVGYGANLTQLYRDIYARQCVKLLRGVKPADIPVEQPTKFELVINLKTANALGITVPPTLLARADRVVE